VTTDNKVAQPGEIRADKLEPGMWVYAPPREKHSVPGRVLFRSEQIGDYVAVVLSYGLYTRAIEFSPGTLFRVATEAEVEQEKDSSRRRLIASQLRELADLIEHHDLPTGTHPYSSFPSDLAPAELERIAGILGVEVRNTYYDQLEVRFGSYDGFYATWGGHLPYVADPSLPLGHVFIGSGQVCMRTVDGTLCQKAPVEHVTGGDAAVIVAEATAAPKPAPPKKAAVKRSAPVDKARAARDQDDANTRPAGADQ
jgi:hypothetical protein